MVFVHRCICNMHLPMLSIVWRLLSPSWCSAHLDEVMWPWCSPANLYVLHTQFVQPTKHKQKQQHTVNSMPCRIHMLVLYFVDFKHPWWFYLILGILEIQMYSKWTFPCLYNNAPIFFRWMDSILHRCSGCPTTFL